MKIFPVALQTVASLTQARIEPGGQYNPDGLVCRVLTDSRSLVQAEGSLFVAIKTRSGDGHKYIEDLYRHGVRYFLVSRLPGTSMPDAVFLLVDDTLKALQRWAALHRKSFEIPVAGITGSNGKTWVKEWLMHLLSPDRRVVCNPKSYNSQIGVPLSLLQMDPTRQIGIFEAGISQPGEMEALNAMICPTTGIFTNIGAAHDANFESREQKIREKLKLFKGVKTLVYCADYRDIENAVISDKNLQGVRLLSWSLSGLRSDLTVRSKTVSDNYTEIEAVYKGDILKLRLPFTDRVSLENALHCWLFMLGEDYSQQEIAARFAVLPPVEMRMEMKEGAYNSFLISDVYNSDFNSFGMAVDFLVNRGRSRSRCVILSDIPQSGLSEQQLYGDVAQLLKNRAVEEFIGIGEALCRNRNLFESGVAAVKPPRFYPDTEAFLAACNPVEFANKSVLIKGARAFAFERISRMLQKRLHETVMEVNLSALVHNLNYFKGLIKPETKLMVMGKAFSYGTGNSEIAGLLEYNRVDYLTVAYPDEAVTLRKKGIKLPVMCMNPEGGGMETLLKYNVEPVIYGFAELDALTAYLDYINEKRSGSVKIHLKLDTGMHRMGFESADIAPLTERLKRDGRLRVQSVFTHLATADMPEMDNYTLAQLQRYEEMSSRIINEFDYKIIRHCLNTAGIFRFPEYQYDMVRLGIGLYGVGTDAEMQKHLETVSTLKTSISLIRHIPAGEAVSYGRRFVADRDTVVGVIGIGYADGLNRHLGNGKGRVYVNGHAVPIIGSICMDMCMIDLTGIEARERDEVIVFGREQPVNKLAEVLGTIPYEVLTSVSPRVPRVYFQE